ncbi:MAG TPA: thioredoxin family protein, partial [Kiritimatiellia bacterium]
MSLRKVLRAAGIGMLLLAQADGAELWTDDFEQAMNEAKASGRYLLLDFTGSDWCGWCKRLDAEVFKDDTFKEFAASNLVCVKVDFPMFKEQSDKL